MKEVLFHGVTVCNNFLWRGPVLILSLCAGLIISLSCCFPQVRLFKKSIKCFADHCIPGKNNKERSSFRALWTALAATVGTGNIAGVAGAISLGGPGAVFWMWISAFLGMATKYAESTLAVFYQKKNEDGEIVGGPMYEADSALQGCWKKLGAIYAFCGIIAAFGVGNATQINAILSSFVLAADTYHIALPSMYHLLIGAFFSFMIMVCISHGSGAIGKIAEFLIPVVSVIYVLLCMIAILLHADRIVPVLGSIVRGALQPEAVTGGAVGGIFIVIQTGISRGVFSNEAGMGTAGIAHGGAKSNTPTEQGLMGIMEVFIDTVIICTLTAFMILTSGVSIPYGSVSGSELTGTALYRSFGSWSTAFLTICLTLFSFGTILGWGLYAARCGEFLFGKVHWRLFALLQGIGVMLGTVLQTGIVWTMAELVNGLMAIPNLIIIFILLPTLVRLTKDDYRKGR